MEPIQNAEWAAPIVSVLKKDDERSIHINGDFKCTVNSASKIGLSSLYSMRISLFQYKNTEMGSQSIYL